MGRRKVEVRREEILRATVDQVAESGFASTRVADVAGRLGISAGLVFYHFESKEALLSQAFAYAAERDLERLDAAAGAKGSATRRLARILALYGPEGSGAGWSLWIDAWASALRTPEMAEVSQQLDVRWKDTVAAVIAEGVERGEMTCSDHERCLADRFNGAARRARCPARARLPCAPSARSAGGSGPRRAPSPARRARRAAR